MTVVVRDEDDILDAQVAFHLNAGVDFVLAADHESTDGTAEILERYEREGLLHAIRVRGEFQQGEWVTRLARLAATDFRADWVINSDADEFFWPHGGSLKDVLSYVPSRFGSVRGMWRHFVPRPDEVRPFAERMTVRLCNPTHGYGLFNPHFKTVHRADPEVIVRGGNHHVFGDLGPLVRSWFPIEVLHFPIRSLEQCERRYLRQWETDTRAGRTPLPQPAEAYEAHQAGRMNEFYENAVVDDDELARGLREGKYTIDTRLRDALRALDRGRDSASPSAGLVGRRVPLDFSNRDVDKPYVSELGLLGEVDELVRLQHRIAALETRLAGLESSALRRLRIRLAERHPVRG